ncbi:peptide chain release factor N(5)-glutamine methyltransferase [Metamycoplasma neophronis]|uniref:peptide chain release factor N(5)-glutamine methyltransferase n=1 Tax=Metamycoplasma neophronis TaxID=872983 RepID=A0ABY2Z122_9BACT|nr:peptide chain release factor N(5)-glutamine methyltransferase [Metamycoplasma neophronis]TPR54103.1 peptide chain release factor N(5)-glutamine methyltransferase [Metamycoplasma neophronis]
MIEKEVLLREKMRYGLPLFVSKKELKLLKKDVPVQKIIGWQEMQDVKLDIRYKVLIPRYETEEVILAAYPLINKKSKVLDIGCGSGFIGLAIAKNIGCDVSLIDISNQAIKQTKFNAKLNDLKVNVFKSNLFSKVKDKYNLIISNPPYLNKEDKFAKSLKYEPSKALYAKNKGTLFYELICNQAKDYLLDNGYLVFEIDFNSYDYLKKRYGDKVNFLKDINGKWRIAIINQKNL